MSTLGLVKLRRNSDAAPADSPLGSAKKRKTLRLPVTSTPAAIYDDNPFFFFLFSSAVP